MRKKDHSKFIGKHVIVGVTVLDHEGNFVEQIQVHGKITTIDKSGIVLRQPTGEEYKLPPDPNSLQPAPAGVYKFRTTGEEVVNPDLMTTWTVHEPAPNEAL